MSIKQGRERRDLSPNNRVINSESESELHSDSENEESESNGIYSFPELLDYLNFLSPDVKRAIDCHDLDLLNRILEQYKQYVEQNYGHHPHYDFTPTVALHLFIGEKSALDYANEAYELTGGSSEIIDVLMG